jgi:3D-(3,5/4)-trihydroxycyclohexane-1,2-dione acylhydrolase (decyclizing)
VAVRTIRLTTAQALIRYLHVQESERDGERRRLVPGLFGIFGHGNVHGLGQALDEVGDDLAFYQGHND